MSEPAPANTQTNAAAETPAQPAEGVRDSLGVDGVESWIGRSWTNALSTSISAFLIPPCRPFVGGKGVVESLLCGLVLRLLDRSFPLHRSSFSIVSVWSVFVVMDGTPHQKCVLMLPWTSDWIFRERIRRSLRGRRIVDRLEGFSLCSMDRPVRIVDALSSLVFFLFLVFCFLMDSVERDTRRGTRNGGGDRKSWETNVGVWMGGYSFFCLFWLWANRCHF